jgi:hypothetical protein
MGARSSIPSSGIRFHRSSIIPECRRAKSADLGGDLIAGTLTIDLNFAYQPSCAFDPRWACPLAPPENWLDPPIRAGERLR